MSERNTGRIKRQAVVIIHGMGEQRPMATLRSFVDGITSWIKNFDGTEGTRPRYWSRPDGISEIYETRRITMEQFEGNDKTDFYEFYWAHHMRNTSYNHLVPWIWKLLSAKYKDIPPRLKFLWGFVWALIIVLITAAGIIYYFRNGIIKNLGITAGVVVALTVLIKIIHWLFKVPISQMFLNTAGDAARYFNPMPSNIEERSTIRREGIAFLKKLHSNKEKPYDRIVVVGHSLGSVVAYDMLRLLWQEMYQQFEPVPDPDHKVFDEMDEKSAGKSSIDNIQDFQDLQHRCWQQYHKNGNPWLITDFITCAGAIAHADFFLLNNIPFEKLVSQKEFPTSPPVMEGTDKTLFFDRKTYTTKDAAGNDVIRTVRYLNHAALFAVTRWTNIYFTSDFVGSEAKRIFKNGIKDIEVPRKGPFFLPGGHTNYWDNEKDNEALAQIAKAIGFRQLKKT
ncbi:MAG TPA: hypothetical protein PLA68_04995 [Panacibacter sp.]|nr:hypothetical protein [Panacibacter sp.]